MDEHQFEISRKTDPCPCGSGLRYEKCHRKQFLALKKAKKIFERRRKDIDEWQELYGDVLIPNIVDAFGKRLIGVGPSLFELTPEHDFYTLIWDYALDFLGESFVKKQRKQDQNSKHEIMKWLESYESSVTDQSGAGASWMRFAYDVYTVGANAGFAERIKEKLLNKHEFQGARFELWVAALVVAAGFEIEYVDESAPGSQHPEFIATHKQTKQRIAI